MKSIGNLQQFRLEHLSAPCGPTWVNIVRKNYDTNPAFTGTDLR